MTTPEPGRVSSLTPLGLMIRRLNGYLAGGTPLDHAEEYLADLMANDYSIDCTRCGDTWYGCTCRRDVRENPDA